MKLPAKTFLRNVALLTAASVAVVVLLPSKARSQLGLDPCCAIISAGLDVISGLLKNVVATPLASIQKTEQEAADFEQQVIWPLTAINAAKSLATQSEQEFVQMRQLVQTQTSSATLPTPQRLEQALLSRNPSMVSEVGNSYSSLYGPVIAETDAPQPVRDLVDMSDAAAQAAMKRAVEIDALADLELQAAEEMNQQLQTSAPGSSPILDAQASAWLVRANAYTQSAMAELLRVRSIELANNGARLKFSSSHTGTLHSSGSQLLRQGGR